MAACRLVTIVLAISLPAAAAPLVGPTWTLVSLQQGDEILTPQANERYTLTLRDSSRASGVVNCNSCGGAYTATAESLTVSMGFCTDMACQPSDIEGWYSNDIATGGRYVVTGDTLRLYGTNTLVFATPPIGTALLRPGVPVRAAVARAALTHRSVVFTGNGATWFDCRGRRTPAAPR